MSDWEKEHGTQYRNDFNRQKYDRFSVMFPKGKKGDYMKLAENRGMKLNAFVNWLLEREEHGATEEQVK